MSKGVPSTVSYSCNISQCGTKVGVVFDSKVQKMMAFGDKDEIISVKSCSVTIHYTNYTNNLARGVKLFSC